VLLARIIVGAIALSSTERNVRLIHHRRKRMADEYQKKRILAALDCEPKLTQWEWDFINSLADKEDDYDLTEKQAHILNRISQKTGK